jgi:molecular chaperone DnaK
MEIGSGELVTLATDGDVELGGRDWDQRLIDFIADTFRQRFGPDPRTDENAYGRLLRECEDAKRTLSVRQRAHVSCEMQGMAVRIEVTRAQFEELTRDLLERTTFTTRQIVQHAGMSWDDIDRVLLVGGATRMPAVVEMLRCLSGKEPDGSVSPDEAVAQGAAIHAGFLLDRLQGRAPRIRIRNVNSHSLGIAATDPRTSRRQTAFLIPRNTPLPAKAKRVFRTLKSHQKAIVAQIVEGESTDPHECTQIGKCTVRNLPPNLPAGTPIEVGFKYLENGRLRVMVSVAGLEENVTHDIRRENNLTPSERDGWRQQIAGLPPALDVE